MKRTPRPAPALAGTVLFSALACLAAAQTAWIGGTDLNWSTAANWNPATAPSTGATALLGDTGAARTVVYDSLASGTLGTLAFTQTSAFLNALDVQRNLTLTNALTLAASNGGTSQLSISPGSADLNLTATGGIDVQTGGRLALNFGANLANSSRASTITGNVTVSGGTLAVGIMPATQTTGSVNGLITGNLTLSAGTITIDTSTASGRSGDVRLQVNGDFTATGGSLVATGSTKGLLSLNGATNTLSNFTMTSTYGFQLGRSGDQTLTGIPTNTSQLYMRGSGTKTIGSAAGGTISNLLFINTNTNGALVALKLATDLTSSSGTQLLQLATGAASGTNTALGVDVNGHTLDMSTATGASGLARGTNGVWKPNHAGSATGTTWALSSGAAGGRIRAAGYDFSGTNVTVTVGANVSLEATGGNGIANNLGGGAAFDATSAFVYAGNAAGATPATLASGRSIGALRVNSGTLAVTGTTFTAAGGITVAGGAVLDLSTTALTAPTTTLLVNNAAAGQIKTNGFTNAGSLVIDFGAYNGTGSYDLFANATATTGNFDLVSISGLFTATLARSGSVWNGSAGGYDFSFSQATGDLTVTSAIPEPSACALLAGVATLALVAARRNRRA